MSGVELKVCDGESKSNILLPIGKTVIGRGPFLSVADKRVSRNHAVLEVDDGKLKIMSTHTNPTFCLEGSGENLSPLPKDSWHNLGHGDRFSLLPDLHIYEVVIDDRPINKDSQGFTLNTTLSPIKNKEEKLEIEDDVKNEEEKNGESSTLEEEETKSNGQQKENEHDTEEDKEQDQTTEVEKKDDENVVLPSGKPVALPLNKPRNLPSWMEDSDTPTTKESPKGRGRGRPKKSTNSDDATDVSPSKAKPKGRGRGRGRPSNASKPTPRKVPKQDIEYLDDWMGSDDDDDDDDEGSDWEEENKKEQAKQRGSQSRFPRSPTKKSLRKRSSKRTSSDEEIDDLMDEEVYIPRPTKRGRNASRSSYSQSVKEEEEEEEEVVKKRRMKKMLFCQVEEEEVVKKRKPARKSKPKEDVSKEKERTPCTYGKKCFRKNKKHIEEFSHPGDDDYVEEEVDSNEEAEKEDEEDDLPECPYGSDCYRKNKDHFKEYKHSKKEENKRPRRQAAEVAKTKVNEEAEDDEEEDDGPNTYDRDDSFIAESQPTSQDPGSEGSDFNPDEDSEDVKTLVKEAKGFVKNKKMQKKVR